MKCPKCQYVRQPSEEVPEWQCPKCGIAYQKFKAKIKSAPASDAKEKTQQTEEKRKVTATNNDPDKKSGTTFKDLRVLILLLILLFVALDRYFMKANTSDWEEPLRVVVYPINGDDSAASAAYMKTLQRSHFTEINRFMRREAARYGLAIGDPLDIRMGPVIAERPPLPPDDRGMLDTILWSLKFRYWSFIVDSYDGPRPDIRIFTLFYDPKEYERLPHSTGIEQGLLSIVHAFASKKMAKQNNFVITHEMLHTLGATDKYSFSNNQPVFPDGYAEPEKKPLYPQQFAEVMGGRIPLAQGRSVIPAGLSEAIIGGRTAWEIGWAIGQE